jgi:integrase
MGVVFEADHESLGRRVALKVLPVDAARDAKLLARFQRKSRAAAQLHHSNIVPVFEVGQEGDVCFYAMQYIQGQPVDVVIEELRRLGAASGGASCPDAVGAASAVARSLLTGQSEPVRSADVTLDAEPKLGSTPPTEGTGATVPLSRQSVLSMVESNYRLYCRNVAHLDHQVADALPTPTVGTSSTATSSRRTCCWTPPASRGRVVFKFAWDNGRIDRPVRYGQGFKRPSRKVVRIDRARKGPKLFSHDEIRRLLSAAGTSMRARILLGVNCGFGNADCGHLPQSAMDLEAGILDFPRPKTGIPRRCPLWAETIQAIREALANRPVPKKDEHAGLVFITKYGLPWAKDTADQTLAKEFGKLLRALYINGRQGLGFYTLRHTFRTVANESKDQPAVDFIMGHEVPHMSAVHRETISDTRLKAVSDYVHAWL